MDQPSSSKKIKIDDKVFNDPIHGSIRLHPLLVKIIDTPQFQRLRYIKQLGGCCFVYPGATHTRFEHSIGVAHLAGKLVERLQQEQEELDITDRDVMCVKIAGLCHDLGHGPFSHLWDVKVIGNHKTAKKWTHEEASLIMFDHLIENNEGVRKEFENLWTKYLEYEESKENVSDVVKDDLKFIKELIDRDPGVTPTGRPEKKYLYEIVANKRNDIDVDKWDYFKRDCHYLGLTCSFDILRPMEFVRVIKVDGEQQICFRDKEARNIFQMFQTRELLHRQAYKHKTTRIIEKRIADALILADKSETFKIPIGKAEDPSADGKDVRKKMTETLGDGPDPEMYTHLTDHVFEMILATAPTDETDLKKAKEILENIHKRNLYKFLGEICDVTSSEDALVEEYIKDTNNKIKKEDIYTDKVKFDFGNSEKSPFDRIRFFSKHNNQEGKKIPLSAVSSFLPKKFKETVVRFYYIQPTDVASKFTEAKRHFDEWAIKKEKEKEPIAEYTQTCQNYTPDGKQLAGQEVSKTAAQCRRPLFPDEDAAI